MRIAVLILSLVTCFFLFLQAALVNGFSQEGSANNSAAAFGVLMSLFMLVSAAIVLPIPRVAMVLLALSSVIGIIAGSSSDFTDLIAWGIWCLLLAVMSYFGYRGKRKQQAKDDARERVAQDALAANQQMAAQMAQMQQQLAQQQMPPSGQTQP